MNVGVILYIILFLVICILYRLCVDVNLNTLLVQEFRTRCLTLLVPTERIVPKRKVPNQFDVICSLRKKS